MESSRISAPRAFKAFLNRQKLTRTRVVKSAWESSSPDCVITVKNVSSEIVDVKITSDSRLSIARGLTVNEPLAAESYDLRIGAKLPADNNGTTIFPSKRFLSLNF